MDYGEKIIIDTDPGHDDAMALILAFASQELEISAVTTVCGNSSIENTTRNARFILDFLSINDTPLYSGATKPLSRELIQASVHGTSGLEGVDPDNESNLTGDAVEQLLHIVRSNPNQVVVVALGPLTNIAGAIQEDPKTMELVKEIVLMGGAIDVPGNMNRVAEFNIFVDPEAADIVMKSDIKKTLVPLDACDRVYMQMEDLEALDDHRLRDLLTKMVGSYIANLEKVAGVSGAIMYDPLTIFFLLKPEVCETVDMNIQVETKGEVTRGMTVVDKRKISDGKDPNATIVTYINRKTFIDEFITRLNQLPKNRQGSDNPRKG